MSKDYHLALDAMGVIYLFADDLRDILAPFVQEKGGEAEFEVIRAQYHQASDTGTITSADFWHNVGLDPAIEREFLAQYWLTGEVLSFISNAREIYGGVGLLSNDVGEWAERRAEMFGFAGLLDPWIVSGEVGCRKPAPEIYRRYLAAAAVPAGQIIFVDDREANLDGAASEGFTTLRFDPDGTVEGSNHAVVTSLTDLLDPALLSQI